MSAAMERAWLLTPAPSELEEALTSFIARKLMRITQKRDDMMEVKHGSTLAIDLGGTLDWLPVHGWIWYQRDADNGVRVQARIQPRGRPRLLRRGRIKRAYEKKMSSWLEQVGETLRAIAEDVHEVPPAPGRR
jgi:hypothetical protein